MEKFRKEVEAYLKLTGMAPTKFGPAIGVTRTFIHDLRRGSGVSLETAERARKFMADNPAQQEATA